MSAAAPTAPERDSLLVDRACSPLVRDPRVRATIERRGYAVVGPVLDGPMVRALRETYTRLAPTIDSRSADHWYTTGAMSVPEHRRAVYEAVGQVVRPAVTPVAREGVIVLSGNFHVNPAGGLAGLGPHQDIALVDEATASTVNGWIPLSDVTAADGPLHVVPGSHRFGNRDRSLAVPWAYDGLHDLFWEHAVPLEVPAGHLVLFDTAMVHCSTANPGPEDRIAVNCLFLDPAAELRHLVASDDGDDLVDVYRIRVEFLIEGDIASRPGPDVATLIGTRPVHHPVTDPDFVRAQCRAGAALAEG